MSNWDNSPRSGQGRAPKSSSEGEQADPALELRAGFCVLLPTLEILAVLESPNSAPCGCKLLWSCPSPCRTSWDGWEGFAGITRLGKLLSKVQAAGEKGPFQAVVGTGKHKDPFHWKTGNTGIPHGQDISLSRFGRTGVC